MLHSFEHQVRESIRKGNLTLNPLQFSIVDRKGGDPRIDLLLEGEWEGKRRTFAIECKGNSTPYHVHSAVTQIRRYTVDHSGLFPMIIVPYLCDEMLALLISEKTSGLDLSGNGVVIVPGEWFLLRSGQPNLHPASQSIKDIYSGRSSLVGRVLLTTSGFAKVGDIQARIVALNGTISLATVSKVLKRLEDELIVRRGESIELLRPDVLLDRLVEGFHRPRATGRLEGTVPNVPEFLQAVRRSAERHSVDVAGRLESLYAVAPESTGITTIYVSSLEPLLEDLSLAEHRRFPNVELLEIRDEITYFDRYEYGEFYWCSAVQIYLELAKGDKRQREIAEYLRNDILLHHHTG